MGLIAVLVTASVANFFVVFGYVQAVSFFSAGFTPHRIHPLQDLKLPINKYQKSMD
jgi:hypothetical protein